MFEYLIGAIVVFVAIKIYFIIQDDRYKTKNNLEYVYDNVKYLGGYEDKKGGSNIRLEMNNEALFLKFDSANKIIPIRDLKNFKIMTESQIQKDISVGRILILGVFALATNKTKTVTDNYLLLKYNDHGEDRDIILQHDKVEELYNNIKQLKHENDVLVERNII